MSGCQFSREEQAGRAIYTLRGKLDGPCAWELRTRLEGERAIALSIDFSQVSEFADYGVAVLAQAFAEKASLTITGLRQHTLRMFRYFGVDCSEPSSRTPALSLSSREPVLPVAVLAAREVG